ncbi:hypothetical protein UFOVP1462_36 [uncultured Caudovirales phage]|uniref:Phage major tail protein TP901-1 n=1 Tax=uncultured Caudovirales phage TaxID=2100421 RepID=A0A6J5SKS5_9CAUD|nr:hypothetical protein UFOVP1013_36 [uncultured Caudovirales phage]CAB4202973.1 hypothetical protein UFOVP1364_53 [uncultured Caudovirales phage]CAB4214418.1 hypothetical protein UFOVP1462_36 [uncultured Caudovirales phage]CAB5228835.1 hypothetical protein UFOVP1550_45 [uncultured Caudovirales phage]
MARLVLTNVVVTFGVTDISSYVTSVTLGSTYDVVETTAFGNTARTRVAGLADNSVSLELNQDYAASSLESVIYPTLGTAVSMTVKPVAGLVTTSNPAYSFSALISEWTPLNGALGELATASVTWPISGVITKTTS